MGAFELEVVVIGGVERVSRGEELLNRRWGLPGEEDNCCCWCCCVEMRWLLEVVVHMAGVNCHLGA